MNTIKQYFSLDPKVHFLNHGSFGACPKPVFEVYQDWQRQLESQPVLFLGRELSGFLFASRAILAKYLQTAAENIVYVPNATHGINIVARSINLQSGDEVLTSDHEYGACDNTWEFVCLKNGASYVHQHIPLPLHTAEEVLEQLWQGVTERTKVIYISHITSPTAIRLPVEAIVGRARSLGILTVIDGAHAPGQIPLDLEALGADFYFGNCHKWMLSPKGAAFLYAHPEAQHMIEPLIVSWGYHSSPETTTGSRFIDYLQWTGTKDPAAFLSVPAAIQFQHDHQWEQVRTDCQAMLKAVILKICNHFSLLPVVGLDSELFFQMGIAPLPKNTDLTVLKTRLYDEYQVEVPLIEWNGEKFVRISVQGYNTDADLEALFTGLTSLITKVGKD